MEVVLNKSCLFLRTTGWRQPWRLICQPSVCITYPNLQNRVFWANHEDIKLWEGLLLVTWVLIPLSIQVCSIPMVQAWLRMCSHWWWWPSPPSCAQPTPLPQLHPTTSTNTIEQTFHYFCPIFLLAQNVPDFPSSSLLGHTREWLAKIGGERKVRGKCAWAMISKSLKALKHQFLIW